MQLKPGIYYMPHVGSTIAFIPVKDMYGAMTGSY
jgi:hypothetical protein